MAASIVGCVLVSGLLEGGSSLSASGIASGLAAAFFYAVYGILSKKSASKGYTTYTTLFYCLLISTVVLIPFSDLGAFAGFAAEGVWDTGYLVLHAAVAYPLHHGHGTHGRRHRIHPRRCRGTHRRGGLRGHDLHRDPVPAHAAWNGSGHRFDGVDVHALEDGERPVLRGPYGGREVWPPPVKKR